ncbi:MAG: restriction endonuclease subunit S, partial [Clostridiales bacterium]|nr:restriction endonuclease subunit S [Clostridiales bacterium]
MKVKLGEIYTLQMGKTPARKTPEYWNNGNNDWVSIADLSTYHKYVGKTKETISDIAVKESGIKIVPANTVIMSFKLSIGKTAITVKPTYTNEAIMAFIPTGKYQVLPEYAYYLFSGRDWSAGSNKAVMGITLNKATLQNVEITVPSLEVQRNVIEKLDKVSKVIALQEQQLATLDELVKARFVEMFGDPYTNPMNWNIVSIGDVISNTEAGWSGNGKQRAKKPGEIAVLKVSAVTKGYFIPEECKILDDQINIKKYVFPQKGDLLFSRANTREMGISPTKKQISFSRKDIFFDVYL